MAIRDFYEPCVIMDRITHDDPIGGVVYEWVEGAHVKLAISTNSSTQAQLAYQTGAKVLYTIAMDTETDLSINDRIKRLRDGTVLRLTSDPADMQPPDIAEVKFKQARAEAVKL